MLEDPGGCPDASLLVEFHGGRLVGPAARRVAEHTETCAACCAELAELSLDDRFADDLCWLLPGGPTITGLAAPASHESEREALVELLRATREADRYELLGELGHGGMGVVYAVRDRVLQRELAMKVARVGAGNASSPASPHGRRLARFIEEVRITGRLDHPSIIPVHELGIDSKGNAYFTMRQVHGRNLQEVFEEFVRGEGDWTLQRLVAIVLRACEALEYAHSMRVVHRDLKPANIMVEGFGAVYVMDWGVSKLVREVEDRAGAAALDPDSTRRELPSALEDPLDPHRPASAPLTLAGEVLGTPTYMAPEQARGRKHEPSFQSDVYSMGAILYQLLSGQEPYKNGSPDSTPRSAWKRLLEGPPTPLLELAPRVRPELVAICERAMAREPSARYLNMTGLTSDLRAWLEGRVVRAHKTGVVVEVGKWVRRNPALASAALLALAVVPGLLVRHSVVEASTRDRVSRGASIIAAQGLLDRNPANALREAIPVASIDHNFLTRTTLLAALVPPAKDVVLQCLPSFESAHQAWSPRGELLVAERGLAGARSTLRIWDLKARDFTAESFPGPPTTGHVTIFDPEGRRIACAGADGSLSIHDRRTGESRSLGAGGRAHALAVTRLAFSHDGKLLASASFDECVKLWDAATGEFVKSLIGHSGIVTAIEFDGSSERLLSASGPTPSNSDLESDHSARIWDVASGGCLLVFEGHEEPVTCAHFDRTGELVLSTSYDHTAQLWSANSGEVQRHFEFESVGWDGAFSPDGSSLALAFDSGFLLMDLETGREERFDPYEAHDGRAVSDVEYSPSGEQLLTVGFDQVGRIWRLGAGLRPRLDVRLRPMFSRVASWSPDGSRIASSTFAASTSLWFAEGNPTTDWVRPEGRPATHARFYPAGDGVLLSFEDSPAYEFSFHPKQGLHSGRRLGEAPAADVATTADGAWTLVAEAGGPLRLWRRDGEGVNQEAGVLELDALSLHPMKKQSVLGLILGRDEGVAVLDLTGATPRITRLAGGERVTAIDIDEPTWQAAVGTAEGGLRIFDLEDGRELLSIELPPRSSHSRAINAIAFCDAARHLLSAGPGTGIELRDVQDGHDLRLLEMSLSTIGGLLALSDGQVLSRDQWGSQLVLTRLSGEYASIRLHSSTYDFAHDNRITAFSLDSAQRRVLTTSLDHTATVWDLEQLEPWISFTAHGAPVLAGDLSRDGRWAVTADATGRAFVWPTDPLSWVEQAQHLEPSLAPR